MTTAPLEAIQPKLRVSGVLLILGIVIELISLLWAKPLAFLLFAFGGGVLLGGIALYLLFLVPKSRP
jgi:hypothetical protein